MKKIFIAVAATILIIAAISLMAIILAGGKTERPPTAGELLDLGEKYLLDLDYEQALVQFLRVIEIDPLNPRGYMGAAEAYLGMGDIDGAIAVLQQGLKLMPDNKEIKELLAELLEQVAAATATPLPPPTDAYKKGDTVEFGGYEWMVLEVGEGTMLVLSKYVLEFRSYHGTWSDEEENMSWSKYLSADAISWAECDLRAYLNGEFLNRFNASDKARIVETHVVNSGNPMIGIVGSEDTADRIFLLSIEEVVRYFGDIGRLIMHLANRSSTDPGYWASVFGEYNDVRVAYSAVETPWGEPAGVMAWWWLRSPSFGSNFSATVSLADVFGVDNSLIRSEYGGVRPALWLVIE